MERLERGGSMSDDPELYKEIIWVMTYYGSDAGEKQRPGSKLESQALRIIEFIKQRREAREYVHANKLDLVKAVRYRDD